MLSILNFPATVVGYGACQLREVFLCNFLCCFSVTSLANYCNRRLEVLKVNFCKNITVPSLVKLASHCRRYVDPFQASFPLPYNSSPFFFHPLPPVTSSVTGVCPAGCLAPCFVVLFENIFNCAISLIVSSSKSQHLMSKWNCLVLLNLACFPPFCNFVHFLHKLGSKKCQLGQVERESAQFSLFCNFWQILAISV